MEKSICFVIAPIGEEESETRKRSNQIFRHLISETASALGYKCIRADHIAEPGIITDQVIQHIVNDPLVIADLSGHNPNVFYEIAIRHMVRKPLIQIIGKGERIPFDVAGMRTIQFDHKDLDSVEAAKKELRSQIEAIRNNPEARSAVPSIFETLDLAESPLSTLASVANRMRNSLHTIEERIAKSEATIISHIRSLPAFSDNALQATFDRQRSEEVVAVRNTHELVGALASSREITLQPGTYNITGAHGQNYNVAWESVYDGEQLVVSNLQNVRLVGVGESPVKILARPRYAYVLSFRRCSNISIENIEFAHTEEPGYCTGGVLSFEECDNITINGAILRGSGHEGLTLTHVKDFSFVDSMITECTYSILTIEDSTNVVFKGAQFFRNEEFDLISVNRCNDVSFNNCDIFHNKTGAYDFSEYCLFVIDSSSRVVLHGSRVKNNSVQYFLRQEGTLSIEESEVDDNTFGKGKYKSNPK